MKPVTAIVICLEFVLGASLFFAASLRPIKAKSLPVTPGGAKSRNARLRDSSVLTATTIHLSASSYNVEETAGFLNVTVNRSGDTSGTSTVNYATSDTAGLAGCDVMNNTASERCDYETTVGTLRFAAGD